MVWGKNATFMKTFLLALLASILLFSCSYPCPIGDNNSKDPNLKVNQLFYHKFGSDLVLFIVRDKNSKGYYITSSKWLYNDVPYFESFKDLDEPSFKPLRMATKHEIDNWDKSTYPINIDDSLSIIVDKTLTK